MISAVGTQITTVIGWIGDVLGALLSGELSALLPLFAVGIAISAIMVCVKLVKSFVWGA